MEKSINNYKSGNNRSKNSIKRTHNPSKRSYTQRNGCKAQEKPSEPKVIYMPKEYI